MTNPLRELEALGQSLWLDDIDRGHLRSGLFGAAIMSSLVWWINVIHGVGPATIAALKQAGYTFLFGGLIMRLCRRLAEREGSEGWRVAAATVIPS